MRQYMKHFPTLLALFIALTSISYAQDDDMAFDDLLPDDAPVLEEATELVELVEDAEDAEDAAMDAALDEEVAAIKEMPQKSDKPEDLEAMARKIAAQYEVKLQASEEVGYRALEQGYQQLGNGAWITANDSFLEALNKIPQAEKNKMYLDRANWGVAEANYQQAFLEYKSIKQGGDLDAAMKSLDVALTAMPTHKQAATLKKKVLRASEKIASGNGAVNFSETSEVLSRHDRVAKLLNEGKQFYYLGRYEDAEERFEGILFEEPWNRDALRFLKKVADKKYRHAKLHREYTSIEMMYQVTDSWNLPLGEKAVKPKDIIDGGKPRVDPAKVLEQKMAGIIIPNLQFRQANIVDVINFLVETSRAEDPEGDGINIILNLQTSDGGGSSDTGGDAFDGGFDGGLGDGFDLDDGFDDEAGTPSSAGGGNTPLVTLNLRRVNLLDALKFVTELTDLIYRIERGVVVIRRSDVIGIGGIITRFYPVDPTLFNDFAANAGSSSGGGGDGFDDFDDFGAGDTTATPGGNVRSLFEQAGVPFPKGSSIIYNRLLSKLIVANTPENIEKFEEVLGNFNITPRQIEIEARFVEVEQTDMEEAGLEWILRDNWELASRNGNAPIASRERVQIDADQHGFSRGLRFFNFDNSQASRFNPVSAVTAGATEAVGAIATVSGILTNPELSVVLHALDQQGSTDLLSAPRVTTLNGVNAQIEVVSEIIYPTEFEISDNEIDVGVGGSASGGSTIVVIPPPTVIPGSFETREVGVILNVTPSVSPDNYTINLTLVPEISELVDWLQYGSVFPDGLGGTSTINIPQPVFASRNITTSLIVWDGHTVVMGGLIREDLVSFKDKIPLLGDIPWLGRLFRTEGERSTKRNLLIFVTATLVNPAGEPINKRKNSENIDVLPTALNP